MTCSKWSLAIVFAPSALLLSLSAGPLYARDADLASRTFAVGQAAKGKCANTCRARYRECLSLKQAPSFECRDVYRDCTRLSCKGLVD